LEEDLAVFPVIALSQKAAVVQVAAILSGILPFLIASITVGIGIFQPASQTAKIDPATRARPSFANHNATEKIAAKQNKGGEAPKGACQPCPRSSDGCRHPPTP
jgi:hypothetical protein